MTIKHIHEVVFLIEKSNGALTAEKLIDKIAETWGKDVHFAACSGTAFPKEYALDFLLDRQKVFLLENGMISLHPSMSLCDGHEEFEKNKSIN